MAKKLVLLTYTPRELDEERADIAQAVSA